MQKTPGKPDGRRRMNLQRPSIGDGRSRCAMRNAPRRRPSLPRHISANPRRKRTQIWIELGTTSTLRRTGKLRYLRKLGPDTFEETPQFDAIFRHNKKRSSGIIEIPNLTDTAIVNIAKDIG